MHFCSFLTLVFHPRIHKKEKKKTVIEFQEPLSHEGELSAVYSVLPLRGMMPGTQLI